MNKSIWQTSWPTRCVVYCMPSICICHICIIQYDISFRASLKKLQNCTTSLAKHLKYIAPFIVQQCFCLNPSFASLLINGYWYAGCGHVHWSEEIWAGQGLLFTYIDWVGVYFSSSCCLCSLQKFMGNESVSETARDLMKKQAEWCEVSKDPKSAWYAHIWMMYILISMSQSYIDCAFNHVSW